MGNVQDGTNLLTAEDIARIKESRIDSGLLLKILKRNGDDITVEAVEGQAQATTIYKTTTDPGFSYTKFALGGGDSTLSTVNENPIVDESRERIYFLYDRSDGHHILAAIFGTPYSASPDEPIFIEIDVGSETREPTAWAFDPVANLMAISFGKLADSTGDATIYLYRMKFATEPEDAVCLDDGCGQEGESCDRTPPSFGESLGSYTLTAWGVTPNTGTGQVAFMWWHDGKLGLVGTFANTGPEGVVAWQRIIPNLSDFSLSARQHIMSFSYQTFFSFDGLTTNQKSGVIRSAGLAREAYGVIGSEDNFSEDVPFGFSVPEFIHKKGKYLYCIHGDLSGQSPKFERGWQPNISVIDLDLFRPMESTDLPLAAAGPFNVSLSAQYERYSWDFSSAISSSEEPSPWRLAEISRLENPANNSTYDIYIETEFGRWKVDIQEDTAALAVYSRSHLKFWVVQTDPAPKVVDIDFSINIYAYPLSGCAAYYDYFSTLSAPTQRDFALVPASTPTVDPNGNTWNESDTTGGRSISQYTDEALTSISATEYQADAGKRQWLEYPYPLVEDNGVAVDLEEYSIDYDEGIITFDSAPSGPVTATFDAYDTNTAVPLIISQLSAIFSLGGGERLAYLSGPVAQKPHAVETIKDRAELKRSDLSLDVYDRRIENIVFLEARSNGEMMYALTDLTRQRSVSAVDFPSGQNSYISFFDPDSGAWLGGDGAFFHLSGFSSPAAQYVTGMKSLASRGEVWAMSGLWDSSTKGLWIWRFWTQINPAERVPNNRWGSDYADAILDGNYPADERGQGDRLLSYQITQQKDQASMKMTLAFEGRSYLPWIHSRFNKKKGSIGEYEGLFDAMNKIIAVRLLKLPNSSWKAFEEFNGYILESPAVADGGFSDLSITCGGIISAVVTRCKFAGYFEPDLSEYENVTFTAVAGSGDKIYEHLVGGEAVVDWADLPAPTIYVDGAQSEAGAVDLALGTVTFGAAQTGKTITASFTAYDAGTNEAEDIIKCILRFPQEARGCGLSDDFFTRGVAGEALTDSGDGLTFATRFNNTRSDKDRTVYVDGVEQSSGITWSDRDGEVTFDVAPSGTVTADYFYYTLQASGVTLRPIEFDRQKYRTAWDCIQEVVRQVAPNYIVREGPDGKIEADFRTQKADGSEDVAFDSNDAALSREQIDPAFDSISTCVESYGSSNQAYLTDEALDADTTDQRGSLSPPWSPLSTNGVIANLVDGDPNNGWGEGWGSDSTGHLRAEATGSTGLAMGYIDLGEPTRLRSIVVARGSGHVPPNVSQRISLWYSNDALTWTPLISSFALDPSTLLSFEEGTDFKAFVRARYIQLRLNNMETYFWKRGKVNYEWSVEEIYVYSDLAVSGLACLQDEDPNEDLFDSQGLLRKYGKRTYTTRSGQSDETLKSESAADGDAKNILNEIRRLQTRANYGIRFLPSLGQFATIKHSSGPLGRTTRTLIESISKSNDGDSFDGVEYP